MPPAQPVPGVVKASILWNLGDLTAHGRLFMAYTGGPPSAADCATYGDDIVTAFGANLATNMVAGYTAGPVEVQDLSSDTALFGTGTTSHAGTESADPLPVGVCVLINHQIARKYRGGHPRSYWPFGSEADLASNKAWSGTFVANVQTNFAAFIAAISGVTVGDTVFTDHVAVSYFDLATYQPVGALGRTRRIPTPRIPPIVDKVTASVVSAIPGSQRRRYRSV